MEHERFLVKNAHEYHFPNSYHGPYKIKCVQCDDVQEYSSKSNLLRALGYCGSQKNIGMCGKCSKSASRNHPGYNQYYNGLS